MELFPYDDRVRICARIQMGREDQMGKDIRLMENGGPSRNCVFVLSRFGYKRLLGKASSAMTPPVTRKLPFNECNKKFIPAPGDHAGNLVREFRDKKNHREEQRKRRRAMDCLESQWTPNDVTISTSEFSSSSK